MVLAAVHMYAEFTTNCSDLKGRSPLATDNCQRRDYDPKTLLTSPRSVALNAALRLPASNLQHLYMRR